MLWKILAYKRSPTRNIVLGDSRFVDISTQYFEEELGGKVTNLSIPGGNNKSLSDLFWMASGLTKLDNVIIQIGFSQYNASSNYDLYKPAQEIINNPSQYFLNSYYLVESFVTSYYSVTKSNWSYKNSEDDWDFAKGFLNKLFSASSYVYPEQAYKDLTLISEYCRKGNINLIFVIAPDYNELHNIVKSSNLEKEYYRFKNDIKSLGPTIDLDSGLPFSFNKDNYSDYFHVKSFVADSLVSMIFQSGIINKKAISK
jgi:hypothetical protein